MTTVLEKSEPLTQWGCYLATQAGVGALAGYLFHLIHPLHGACFSMTAAVASQLLQPLLNKLFDDTLTGKILKYILNFFISLTVAALVISAVGVSLSFTTTIVLSLAMIPIALVADCCMRMTNAAANGIK